ncbi:unnamed protein product [Allacma fusca]|uniref:EGF-like domain-containing protein n=1 Tax=Allacma fusca TaxID=39272 RepID=A0A8J2JVL9_9HEXA|nr:unnamed protein product [Allacma fusca]
MSSPYQPKSPLPMGSALATAKKLFQSDNLQTETADSNSTLSTLPSQARLVGGPPASNPKLTGIPSAPVILPVFPNSTPHSGQVTGNGAPMSMTARSLPRNQYSPSRFTLQKDCRVSDRCSWKCISVALILLCIALISILIYFAAVMGNCSRYPGTGCIVVEDAKVMARGEKHFPVIDLTSISPRSSDVEMVSPTSLVPEVTSKEDPEFNDGLTPAEIIWGQVLTRRMEPYSYWTLEMNMRENGFANLNLSFPWGSNWALLFRKNALPSVTQHDIIKIVKNGRVEHRNRRRHVRHTDKSPTSASQDPNDLWLSEDVVHHHSYHPDINSALLQLGLVVDRNKSKRDTFSDQSVVVLAEYLDSGKWFLRLFNDDYIERRVRLQAQMEPTTEIACPQQCSENGNCIHGKCHCAEGFSGTDCSNSVCPVLCSNHGRFGGGACHCNVGWKGAECDIPESECEIGNCHGNGDCINGKCSCKEGWTGEFCNERDCADRTCSQHGVCTQGKCLCQPGWAGQSCNFPETLLEKCFPDCSGHGDFDTSSGKCVCQKPFTGPNCLNVACETDCGRNGFCNGEGHCECLTGWSGDQCELLTCDGRCQDHGQCKNGTCLCSMGWNGKHCTIAGCANSCSHHGSCIMQDGSYSCKCSSGWAGLDCSVRLETNCSDDIDNDEDGMTDCADSECCENPYCREHLLCMAANDPVEVLLRKQPPSVTSSFFQRVKFLIEENSVQSYAQKDEYSERRVSVIRGQVLSSDGLGIVGIRVGISVDKSQRFGFTLTRKGGWFDMLVNGGGSVTLQFQRSPFRPMTRTVFVPWNEIVVLDPPVIMSVGSNHHRDTTPEDNPYMQRPCLSHNLELLKPIVMSSWLPAMVGAKPDKTIVFGESQILQESIVIPGSDVHLLYHSSQSPGYLATILMQLTGPEIPPGLVLVHLKITIEGELYTKTFEADPNITHTFGWKKRNVYQQKVYGLALARVAIGYEYRSCAKPIWTVQTVTLKGFDVDIADVGGWNLDIHHHYNFGHGIIQKGDGSEVHLKELPNLVTTVLGKKGQQRSLLCEPCESLLLSPIALATGPDGSLYVGDFNLIRRITPDGRIYTILQLSATKVSHQYYLTVSPADGHLYISDPEKYQVLRVNSMEEIEDPRVNWSPVVGSGLKCVPGDPENCGDGFPAKLAKLNHPKGLAVTQKGSIYIADGPNIRFVDGHDIIHTLVGSHGHRMAKLNMAKPTDFESCRLIREEITKVQLHWPSNLALNLIENSLLFIDEGILFRVTDDNQVERVLKCDSSEKVSRPILDLAFSPKGQLYFITEDSNLFTVRTDGHPLLVRTDKVAPYGQNHTDGDRQRNNLDAGFVSALSIGADGTIYVADQANLELKQVSHFMPMPNVNGDYEVAFPATGEIYVFNRYGQHILTKDLKSGKILYSFLYTKNTSYGKLSKISDSAENKILFLRDYNSIVSTIENTQGKKCSLKINHLRRLVHFQEMENSEIMLEYSDDGLLLAKTTTTGLSSLYTYDRFGRIRRIIGETGVLTDFEYGLSGPSIQVEVSDSVSQSGVTRYDILRSEEMDKVTITQASADDTVVAKKVLLADVKNVSCSLAQDSGVELSALSWGVFPLLGHTMPVQGNLMRGPSFQYMRTSETPEIPGNKHEWKFSLLGDRIGTERILDRQMWVNDSRALTIEFDQSLSREVIYNRDRESIFSIQYDNTGLPLYFIPASNIDHRFALNITYDRFNRIENWKWGESRGMQVTYGRNGFATEMKTLEGVRAKTIEYNEYGQPSKISLQSGRNYSFHYDIHGGLRSMETPKSTRHSFTFQYSIGFTKLIYQPPGYGSIKNSFVKYFNSYGLLESVWLPSESGRILYDYDLLKRLAHTLYSEGKISYKYKPRASTVSIVENKFESTTHIWTNGLTKILQAKLEFGPKLGFANARFSYEYDSNFRPTVIRAKVGGNLLPDFLLGYNSKTGLLDQVGNFRISQPNGNETVVFDGIAIFTEYQDGFGQPLQYSLTLQSMEVFRLQYSYYPNSHRLHQLRMVIKTAGYNDQQTYAPLKNFNYDVDGQLISVESAEPWKFEYDPNGNLRSLTYRGNTIPLEHNTQDRIVHFGDGSYKYDSVGRVVQNAKEEFYTYNTLGHLKRVWKEGRFEVDYFYDSEGRLVARKDNHGNTTQFFYADVIHPMSVTHIYSPRENRLLHLVYNEEERLIFFQVNRNQKYYVASDHCGTPMLIFNQNGRVVRELSRSPYGHIVYDSDPYFYLPIDYCGGILDKVTLLIHTKSKRVYDPLIGQYLTPDWDSVVDKVQDPETTHLYRLHKNDPINTKDSTLQFDHMSWLDHLGYKLETLAPQLFPDKLGVEKNSEMGLVASGLEIRMLEKMFDVPMLRTISKSVVTKSTLVPNPAALISQIDPPLGKNILLSRTVEGKAMISCPFCTSNRIYRDVFTQILNGSEFLSYIAYSPGQDVFHFAKKEAWKASDDLAELQRLGGQVNVTVHDRSSENQMVDLRIQMSGATISVKYGMSGSRELNRLIHHAKSVAVRKAWTNIKDQIRTGFPVLEFSASEKEEIAKNLHLNSHHTEFTHNPEDFPFFADDPLNIRVTKKTKSQRNRSNPNNHR